MPENAEAEHVLYCVARDADWLLANSENIEPTPATVRLVKAVMLDLIQLESYLRTRQSTRRVA